MNREELEQRIEAVNQKIEKAIKNRDKYLSNISDENKKYTDVEKYSYTDIRKLPLSYDEEVSIDSCRAKNSEIKSLTNTLNKYKDQLNKLDNFENQDKVKVIWDFLLRWKEDTFNKVIKNAQYLYVLDKKYKDEFNKYKEENKERFEKASYMGKIGIEQRFSEDYYSDIFPLTRSVYIRAGKVDEKRLNNILDRDIQSKYTHIINKVKKVCGEIVDASNLHIGDDGTINGLIKGTIGNGYVETIVAGGYNIQIAHYRVIIHKVK